MIVDSKSRGAALRQSTGRSGRSTGPGRRLDPQGGGGRDEAQIAGSADFDRQVALLKALADPLRWRIVNLLADEQLCVCHLTEMLHATQPLVSHHLRVLRETGLLDSERSSYWTYYRLRPEALAIFSEELAALVGRAPAGTDKRKPCR